MIEIHAVCPKCKTDYGKPTDVKRLGNCSVCLLDRVEIVALQLTAVKGK